ncbi:MAG: hypothetical protein HC875_08400 [Anaerolineales bacterium]|nr:hypothetical protein [Anaerolineales bacterium]
MKDAISSYSKTVQGFHWLSTLLILILLPMGLVMTRIADGATKTTLYRIHIVMGLLILVITVFRVIWRFKDRAPDALAGLSALHQLGLKAVHLLLYILLFVLIVSGIGMIALSGLGWSLANVTPEAILKDIPPVFTHGITSRLYILLVIIHLVGVLIYQFKKSNVMARMGVSWFPGKHA